MDKGFMVLQAALFRHFCLPLMKVALQQYAQKIIRGGQHSVHPFLHYTILFT